MTSTLVRDASAPPLGAPICAARATTRRYVVVAAWLALTACAAVMIFRHPMWFDELQAWNIARASSSPLDLLTKLRYEGHPFVWYTLLFGITRATSDARAMQALEFVVLAATFWVVLFRAPFPFALRLGLSAGYFLFFEYGVISRSYGVEVLLLVVLLAVVVRPMPRWTTAAIVAALLALTSLAGALLVLVFTANVVLHRARPPRAPARFVAITGAAAAISVAVCVPPSDFHNFAPGLGGVSRFATGPLATPASALAGVWRALVPVPQSAGAWNSNVLDPVAGTLWLQAMLGVFLIVVVWWALEGAPAARSLWLLGCAAFFGYSVLVILPEQARYAGVVMLLFLACAWTGWEDATEGRTETSVMSARLPRVLAAVVGVQLVATLLVAPFATAANFSPARSLSSSIRASGLRGPVVSGDDFDALTIGGYLGADVYSVARRELTPYFVHDDRQAQGMAKLTDARIECAASQIADRYGRPLALVVRDRNLDRFAPVIARSNGVMVLEVRPGTRVAECDA